MKTYTKAPLPFSGQKRMWIKTFMHTVEETQFSCYVDLFGGSGLLSHAVKTVKPNAKVIYNDFDGYSERLTNINRTNALLSDLREILQDIPDEARIAEDVKERLINRIEAKTGYIDWATVSASLLFTMHHVNSVEELGHEALYNNIRAIDYNADGYLAGCETVCRDYRELVDEYRDRDALFIFDPPYLSTDNTPYKEGRYWTLKDYLSVVKAMLGIDYIYFASEKSQIEELFIFMQDEFHVITPFSGAQKAYIDVNGKIVKYKEYIFVKIRDEKRYNLFTQCYQENKINV
jgi:site-specific DNA-adenine methylase